MTRRYPSNLVKYEMCNKQAETAFQILSVADRRPIIKPLTNTIVDWISVQTKHLNANIQPA